MKINKSAFTIIETMILLVVILLLFGVGIFIHDRTQTKENKKSNFTLDSSYTITLIDQPVHFKFVKSAKTQTNKQGWQADCQRNRDLANNPTVKINRDILQEDISKTCGKVNEPEDWQCSALESATVDDTIGNESFSLILYDPGCQSFGTQHLMGEAVLPHSVDDILKIGGKIVSRFQTDSGKSAVLYKQEVYVCTSKCKTYDNAFVYIDFGTTDKKTRAIRLQNSVEQINHLEAIARTFSL